MTSFFLVLGLIGLVMTLYGLIALKLPWIFERDKRDKLLRPLLRNMAWLLFAFIAVSVYVSFDRHAAGGSSAPTLASLPLMSRPYVPPSTAPTGHPWPQTSGYVAGYPQLGLNGLSTVTIDNTQMGSDAFIKLVRVDRAEQVIRHVYVKARDRFTMLNVEPGRFNIRYMDMKDGHAYRTDGFNIEEVSDQVGGRFMHFTLTLKRTVGGNMPSRPISNAQF